MIYLSEDETGDEGDYRRWVSLVLDGPVNLNFGMLLQEFLECFPEARAYQQVADRGNRSGKRREAKRAFLERVKAAGYTAPEETLRSYFLAWLQRNHAVVQVPFAEVELPEG